MKKFLNVLAAIVAVFCILSVFVVVGLGIGRLNQIDNANAHACKCYVCTDTYCKVCSCKGKACGDEGCPSPRGK